MNDRCGAKCPQLRRCCNGTSHETSTDSYMYWSRCI
jgi:hypothetical protein